MCCLYILCILSKRHLTSCRTANCNCNLHLTVSLKFQIQNVNYRQTSTTWYSKCKEMEAWKKKVTAQHRCCLEKTHESEKEEKLMLLCILLHVVIMTFWEHKAMAFVLPLWLRQNLTIRQMRLALVTVPLYPGFLQEMASQLKQLTMTTAFHSSVTLLIRRSDICSSFGCSTHIARHRH